MDRVQLSTAMETAMMTVMIMGMMIGVATPGALTPLVHMTNHCYKTVYLNESLILDLTDTLQADRVMVGHLSCAVTLQAPPDARVYVHVLQLAISDHAQMPDRLHIYEVSNSGKITKRLTPSTGLYGVLERPFLIYNTAGVIVPDFRSSGSRMRLDYQGKPTIIYRGFRVLATVFYTPEVDGKCRSGTLHCPYAGTCIPFAVRCDTFPNCGLDDNSDEKTCQREYVVTGVLDEYSTRTAVIAAVAGILVFLGVAILVFIIVLKYTRKKYGRSRDQLARYTSRGGGANASSREHKEEADLARLYAPPSYEDVMTPPSHQGGPEAALLARHYGGQRHCGPPPAYSAVAAALVHHHEGEAGEGLSSEEDISHKRPSRLWCTPAPAISQPSRTQQQQQQQHSPYATRAEQEDEEFVRMHGTWPSDTDEEEEVRARRRKKGGKSKGGKFKKHGSKSQGVGASAVTGELDKEDGSGEMSSGADLPRSGSSRKGGQVQDCEEPPAFLPSSSSPESHSDGSSPRSHKVCPAAESSGGSSGAEIISETESQLASSKRNSRTESNTPDSSSGSSLPETPEKHPQKSTRKQPPQSEIFVSPNDLQDLNPDSSSSSVHRQSPSVIPMGKVSSSKSLNGTCSGSEQDKASDHEDFVDIRSHKKSSRETDCFVHS